MKKLVFILPLLVAFNANAEWKLVGGGDRIVYDHHNADIRYSNYELMKKIINSSKGCVNNVSCYHLKVKCTQKIINYKRSLQIDNCYVELDEGRHGEILNGKELINYLKQNLPDRPKCSTSQKNCAKGIFRDDFHAHGAKPMP